MTEDITKNEKLPDFKQFKIGRRAIENNKKIDFLEKKTLCDPILILF